MAAIEIPDDTSNDLKDRLDTSLATPEDQQRAMAALRNPTIAPPMKGSLAENIVPANTAVFVPGIMPSPSSLETKMVPNSGELVPPIGQPMKVPGASPTSPTTGATAQPTAPTAMPASPPKVQAMPMPTLPTPQKSALQQLWDKESNIQNPGIRALARTGTGALRVLEGVGSAAFPGIAAMIPGSAINTRIANNQADKRAEEEQAMQVAKTRAGAEETTAGAKQSEAIRAAAKEKREAEAAGKPKPKEESWKELPGFTGPNGEPLEIEQDSGQVRIAGGDITGIKKTDQKADDFTSFYQQGIKEGRYTKSTDGEQKARTDWAKAENAGKPQEGSFMPLYDEKGHVVGAWNPKNGTVINAPGNLPGTTAPGQHIATEAQTALDKKTAPLKAVIDEADQAATFKDMADKGNAEADVNLALSFFKTMRSSQSGGSGIRFTQQENNLIMGSRGLMDSLEVKGNRVFSNGQPLSKKQRQEILDVINVHKQAAQRQLKELQGGGSAPSGEGPDKGSVPSFAEWKKSQGRQ